MYDSVGWAYIRCNVYTECVSKICACNIYYTVYILYCSVSWAYIRWQEGRMGGDESARKWGGVGRPKWGRGEIWK